MRTEKQSLGKVSITCNGKWENKEYDRLCLVHDSSGKSYISKKYVPLGIELNNEEYWQPFGIGGTGNNVYVSSIQDKNTEMSVNYGDLSAGTTLKELEGKTYNDLFDAILFPSIYPTFIKPSASIALVNYNNIVEIGSSAPTKENFVTELNRGGIYFDNVFQDYRSGEIIEDQSFIFIDKDENNIEFPETISKDSIHYTFKAFYKEGPQPYDNKGNMYGSPLASGSVVSNTVTIKAVYPWYATTDGATTDKIIKQALNSPSAYTSEFTLLSTTKCNQIIETPSEIVDIKIKDPLSGNFVSSSLNTFIKTEIVKELGDIKKTYYRYIYDIEEYGARGEITLKIKF